MALNYSVTNTFSPNTTIASSQVNANFSDPATAFQTLEAGTASLTMLKVDNAPATVSEVARKDYVDRFTGWRRPVLVYVDGSNLDVEANTGTANETTILFPDGDIRSVTEATASTHVNRRLQTTVNASFTGTKDSGMRPTETVANNTWYAVYAVKVQDNTTDFVLSATNVLPITANFSNLNTYFGTDSWVYLGLFRYGDNSGTANAILRFAQAGHTTIFRNVCVGASANGTGTRLASSGGTAILSYTYAAGTGAAQIPNNMYLLYAHGSIVLAATGYTLNFYHSGGNIQSITLPASAQWQTTAWFDATSNINLGATGANVPIDINVAGWMDGALGSGPAALA